MTTKNPPSTNNNDDKALKEMKSRLEALDRSQAVIEFKLDGTIITANQNFLSAMGYTLDEIKGQHHRIFVPKDYAKSREYKQFWERLNHGDFFSDEFKRVTKCGDDIFIQASYNPVLDDNGKPVKVVKYATDITATKMQFANYSGQIDAISKSQAVIEFNMDGTIITANENFTNAVGYSLEEIKGKHHRMFAEPEYAASAEYSEFWEKLNRGEFDTGEYRRLGKNGKEIWIQASYNPICDLSGKPFKVVKYATDITSEKLQAADYQGQLEAISKSQAVIEFNMDGTIITANENFLATVGYALDEIKGKHHRMFAEPEYAASAEYRDFWDQLNRGVFDTGEYRRIGKGGKEVWIRASYNPIFDMNGKPFKVVKYATDVTADKLQSADFEGQLAAIGKSQAVIEFNMDGTIITANENFLVTVGYALDEIKGKHHRMFAEPVYAASAEYREFWNKLNRGEFDNGEYRRLGKGGKEVWIRASYNPIFDMNGKPFKVVKYATDVTADKLQSADFEGQLAAIGKSQAVISFNMDGTIIEANENFLQTVGYTLDEIKGEHHRIFATPEYAASTEYREFWARLNEGKFDTGEYRRLGKGGKEIWIQASYNPIFDMNGRPFKVVKFASDITQQKLQAAETSGQINAIGKAQAVISFNMDGTIIDANENFTNTVGYSLDEIKGKHHRMFASPEVANSAEYAEFWAKLNRGEFDMGEYPRVGKNGKEIWLSASYNPIMDMNGKPFKVVKYATDVTERKSNFEEITAVAKSLEANDLTVLMEKEYNGDYASVKESLNNAITSVNAVLNKMVNAIDQVSGSVGQLRQSSQSLASGAEEQSSAVEEVSANLSETDSQVKSNAENAVVASQLTTETADIAADGQNKMSSMTEAMSAISDSSDDITKIIKVIDDIAFQTNLLALNAAVEAARAGQHGKGFAVVAQEVRNLAARSAKAAKETADLIDDSARRVKDGVNIVEETGKVLGSIVENVLKVKDIVAEIAAASDEQTKGITQINKAMSQVSTTANSSSQQSLELASASDQLSSLTDQLKSEVSRFNLLQVQADASDFMNGLPSDMTPEMMQQMMAILKSQMSG